MIPPSSKIVSSVFLIRSILSIMPGLNCIQNKQTNVNNTPKTITYATLLPPCTILAEREVEGQLCEVKREQDRLKVI